MKHVRQAIGHQLIDALHQCNLADAPDDGREFNNHNDINPKCSRQHEAFGHIENALISLGFNQAREAYCSFGDITPAHTEIDAQYQGVAA